MFRTGGDNINSGRVDVAVTENIRKFCNVLFNAVEHPCKQVAQVMRKHLLRVCICFFTQCFHFPPNVRAAYRLACSCNKNHTVFYSLLCCVAEQFLFQFFNNKHRPCFRFAVHYCLAILYRLNRYILQFADADTLYRI